MEPEEEDEPGGHASDVAVPQPTRRDQLRTMTLAALSAVPVAGSPLAAILTDVWRSTFERRVLEYLEDVADRIGALEYAVDVDARLRDDIVVSVTFDGALAARRATDRQKIAYLADAVANVIADESWSAARDLTLTLMAIVADLTATHIRLLDLLADPRGWQERTGRTLATAPNEAGRYPAGPMLATALGIDTDAFVAAVAGLENRGLLNAVGLGDDEAAFTTIEQLLQGATSSLGDTVLRFVGLHRS